MWLLNSYPNGTIIKVWASMPRLFLYRRFPSSWKWREYGTGADRCGGLYIPLAPRRHRKSFRTASRFPMPTTHEQPFFAHAKSFGLCSLQPTKTACFAAVKKCLPNVGQPLSSVSGRKRYKHTRLCKQNGVPTRMLPAPIGNPEPRGCIPLETHIFSSKKVPKL